MDFFGYCIVGWLIMLTLGILFLGHALSESVQDLKGRIVQSADSLRTDLIHYHEPEQERATVPDYGHEESLESLLRSFDSFDQKRQ